MAESGRLAGMHIALSELGVAGSGLRRPECVLCTSSGDIFVSHQGSGVMHIASDGAQNAFGEISAVDGTPWIPNGIALMPDGSFLVANMGEAGGLWRLQCDGTLSPELLAIDGVPLGATNFVMQDRSGRIWVTVTTRRWPISQAMAPLGGPYVDDAYIILIDAGGPRIVADGLVFANEVRMDADERHLYVVETFGRRITRFRVHQDGSLANREIFTTLGHGMFADGIAFDAEGHLWATSIISNRVLRIAPDGLAAIVLEENDAVHTAQFEQRLAQGTLSRDDVMRTPAQRLKNISSIAFGGDDLRTVYLGSLAGDCLAVFRSGVPGLALSHWARSA